MDEAIVCLSAVFFYPLFIEEEEGFLFCFSIFFVSCFSSLVCSFVYSLFGVVLFALHVLLPYSRTDAIHFKRFY